MDERAITGTTVSNYLTTFFAKLYFNNNKIIALKIVLKSTCKQMKKEAEKDKEIIWQ